MVTIAGDIDTETSPLLQAKFAALVGAGVRELTIDCAEVTFLSSSGLSALISAHGATDRLELLRGNRLVDRLVELTGLQMLYGGPKSADPEP